MVRMALSLGVVGVLLVVAGCTMCCHPYDYCGPVMDDQGCQSCGLNGRAGSILEGSREMSPQYEQASRPVQSRTASRPVQSQTTSRSSSNASLQKRIQADVRQGDVPGSEKIVSVTDRVVEPGSPALGSPQVAVEPSPEPSQPQSAKGWTARRPTPDVMR